MSSATSPPRESSLPTGTPGASFSQDATLEVLSNQRRRFVIHALKQQQGDELDVSDLAERVASWEYRKDRTDLTHRERKRVRNALHQFHLPKMTEYGFVEYDSVRGDVSLTEAASSADFYVDSITGSDIPWGTYYLALSGVSAVVLAGIWFQLFPFTLLAPQMAGLFFVVVLAASSVGHFYDNYYRMRLGARDKPPEVE